MAVSTLTPAATKVATEYNYLNSLSLAQGLHKPVVDPVYVQRYGRQDVTGLLEKLGAKKEVPHIQFSHYEQERIHGVVRLSASAQTASGSGITLVGTAAAAYTYAYTGQSPYTTSDGFTSDALSLYDKIQINGFEMLVTGVANNTFSAISYDSSATMPSAATTDDIIILGNAMPEGSAAPASRNGRMISYTNYMQIMRRSHKVTGTEQGVQTWIETEGKNGEKGYVWYLQGIADEYHRFLNEREAQLLTGENFQNNLAGLGGIGSASIGDADSIVATKGLIPQISADGNVEAYTTGSLAMLDIENMVKNLQKFRGNKDNMLYCGHNFKLDLDALVLENTNLKNGGIQWAHYTGAAGGKQEISFSVDCVEYGGFKLQPEVLDIFSDPNFLGNAGAIYNELGIVVPVGDSVSYNSQNSSTSVTVPSMRMNHAPERDLVEWTQLSKYDGNDFWQVHWLSEAGLECFALNRYGLFVG